MPYQYEQKKSEYDDIFVGRTPFGSKIRYQLSSNKKFLKILSERKNGECKEGHYRRVMDEKGIFRVEKRSVNWKTRGMDSNSDYIIKIQCDAENKTTGNIKIIQKSKIQIREGLFRNKIASQSEDWFYFERRK